MAVSVPKGYLLAGVHCRIKRDPHKQDLSLVMSESPASAAGVYTQNLVYAAPVAVDRARTPSDRMRAVVICSGVANACTGERGLRDAEEMARLAAQALRQFMELQDQLQRRLADEVAGEFRRMSAHGNGGDWVPKLHRCRPAMDAPRRVRQCPQAP